MIGTKHAEQLEIYGGQDPREVATYSVSAASRYLRVSESTLRAWVFGRSYATADGDQFSNPLIIPPSHRGLLTFHNLVEAHVLRALRTDHHVAMAGVRQALHNAEHRFGVGRILLSPRLKTAVGDVFIEDFGALMSVSRPEQAAMKGLLARYLQRVEWDSDRLPGRLFPFIADEPNQDEKRLIIIDPRVSFGRPTLWRRRVTTATIATRHAAGEPLKALMGDHGLTREEVKGALAFERTAV